MLQIVMDEVTQRPESDRPVGGRPAGAGSWGTEFAAAIEGGQMVLHYQPTIDLATGMVVAAEALVRWNHPVHGLIPPDKFLDRAERAGLMDRLTWWVADEAVRQQRTWAERGWDIAVAINLPPSVLVPTFPAQMIALCRAQGVRPEAMELEVTETAALNDLETTSAVLQELNRAGFVIALDDFGTGFSSLAHLRNLPTSVVKLDRSFVTGLTDDDGDAHMVKGSIELAQGLGKTVVAEGVETAAAVDLLLLMGCDQGQGYHWSRPLPADRFGAWLTERRRALDAEPHARGAFPMPVNEAQRMAVLRRYRVLDTAYEAIFDDIAAAAARVCGTPMSAVSLVDSDRQWFKATVGVEVRETERSAAFCAHTITAPDRTLVVADATCDARFSANPLVTGEPNIRFYAGAPLVSPEGVAIGSLCVIDSQPWELHAEQLRTLRDLAGHVMAILDTRRVLHTLE